MTEPRGAGHRRANGRQRPTRPGRRAPGQQCSVGAAGEAGDEGPRDERRRTATRSRAPPRQRTAGRRPPTAPTTPVKPRPTDGERAPSGGRPSGRATADGAAAPGPGRPSDRSGQGNPAVRSGQQNRQQHSQRPGNGDGGASWQRAAAAAPGPRARWRRRARTAGRSTRRRSTRASSCQSGACSTCVTRATGSCAAERLPADDQGRLRLDQPGAALRAAQGRLHRGRLPSGGVQREVPGADPHRHRVGLDPEEARNRPRFEDLTPLFPDSSCASRRRGTGRT